MRLFEKRWAVYAVTSCNGEKLSERECQRFWLKSSAKRMADFIETSPAVLAASMKSLFETGWAIMVDCEIRRIPEPLSKESQKLVETGLDQARRGELTNSPIPDSNRTPDIFSQDIFNMEREPVDLEGASTAEPTIKRPRKIHIEGTP